MYDRLDRYRLLCENLDAASLTPRELAIYLTARHATALLLGAGAGAEDQRADRLAARIFAGEPLDPDDDRFVRERVADHLARLCRQSASDRAIDARRQALRKTPPC